MKRKVLFLCSGNSARSQMAEGLLRHLVGDQIDVFSADTKPSTVNPLAVRVMQERGLDISPHRSKHLDEFRSQPFDYVITVCDNAAESCPVFPGPAQRIHWSFPDPAGVKGDEATRLQAFRQIRNALEAQLRDWLAAQLAAQS